MRKMMMIILAGVLVLPVAGMAQNLELMLSSFRGKNDPTTPGRNFGTRMDADSVWATSSQAQPTKALSTALSPPSAAPLQEKLNHPERPDK